MRLRNLIFRNIEFLVKFNGTHHITSATQLIYLWNGLRSYHPTRWCDIIIFNLERLSNFITPHRFDLLHLFNLFVNIFIILHVINLVPHFQSFVGFNLRLLIILTLHIFIFFLSVPDICFYFFNISNSGSKRRIRRKIIGSNIWIFSLFFNDLFFRVTIYVFDNVFPHDNTRYCCWCLVCQALS